MNNKSIIKEKLNSYLKANIDKELNTYPGPIEAEMSYPNLDPNRGYRTWLPVNSEVSDEDVKELESLIGYRLPEDYIIFLRHKHFYELYIAEASFCKHPINKWMTHLNDMIFKGWPAYFLIEKGFIPFADWSDWGALCFDTNRNQTNFNYPIVLWDHDSPDGVIDVAENFLELLVRLEKENDEMWNSDEI
ncbi:SMI1/KNR4 family protein [Chitinophaga sp. Hz27]|uniref:SMI1/KNR4 family protein n=1 Tax=Chitinophaga sp. Hz27 TaxID=3347169 RepID=UPI0035D52EB2